METKLLLNDLLYIDEHLSCRNYMSEITTGFKYIEFEEEIKIEEECTSKNHLLFFLKGEYTINCNQFYGCEFHEGEMVLLPKSSMVKILATKHSQLLTMVFDIPESNCDKLEFQALAKICTNIEYSFNSTKILYPLMPFMEVLVYCLKNGMECMHLHSIMQREFFFLLRGFYKKEEIAALFYPIIGRELSFKDFVIQNYPLVNSIDELISISKMGRTTFFVKFKDEFGITAKQWMLKQMKERILGKVIEPGICVKQLMDVCGFESQAQLYRYFKQYFDCTPKQLIDRYQAEF